MFFSQLSFLLKVLSPKALKKVFLESCIPSSLEGGPIGSTTQGSTSLDANYGWMLEWGIWKIHPHATPWWKTIENNNS